ncbi:DNA repair protein RecN [bacterium]|nr:DNA repair protein RecN [bacterium]
MLTKLTIKNLALLRDTEINFKPGFSAVTGETGSGKSLFAVALTILSGAKTSPGIVRDGAKAAIIEGEFNSHRLADPVIFRREITSTNRNRIFINDSPVNLKKLISHSAEFIDITAQRAFSHLLEPSRHLDFLDSFANLSEQRNRLFKFEAEYKTLERKLSVLIKKRNEFFKRQDLLSFQLSEINEADPQPDEDNELKTEISRLEHFEEFHQNSLQFEDLLIDGDKSVISSLSESLRLLENLSKIDNSLKELLDELINSRESLKEIAQRISARRRKTVYEEETLERLREREQLIAGIKKKYGSSIGEVLARKVELEKQLSEGDETSASIKSLEKRRLDFIKQWSGLASEVSLIRHKSADIMQAKIIESLQKLGVKDARFEVRFIKFEDENGLYRADGKKWRLTGRGAEDVEFFLSTNPGIEPKPLVQVASGGELSRLLLALKDSSPAAGDDVTVIFDEIDTGVSGRIARLVGKKLKELAQERQLLVITHLPQIAALADHHYKVAKKSGESGTETEILELAREDRIQEIATLVSGGKVTDAALNQARNLMDESIG